MPHHVLVIDDHYENDLQAPDKLPLAIKEVTNDFKPHYAHDYPEAKKILDQYPVNLILIDQFFDREGIKLLNDHLEISDRTPARLTNIQGFLIAQRIAKDTGYLRPPMLIFTSKGEHPDQAVELVSIGILDSYQGKPSRYEIEDTEFNRLVEFIRWHLDPLEALKHTGFRDDIAIDPTIFRSLERKLNDWRCDTPAILQRLLDIAIEKHHHSINATTWGIMKDDQLLQKLDDPWNDPELWLQLLSSFKALGDFKAWHPWTPELPARSRMRYFKAFQNNKQRILMLIDPCHLPEFSLQDRKNVERACPVFNANNSRPFNSFRVILPRLAPSSTNPWLIGVWYEIPQGKDENWIPLSAYRHQQLQEQQSMQQALQDVVNAINQGQDRNEQLRYGYGLVTDGVLINREGKRPGAFNNWRSPEFPILQLRLHPDPEEPEPLKGWYIRKFNHRKEWLQGLAYWFAWGNLPDLYGDHTVAYAWEQLQRLLDEDKQSIPFRIQRWFPASRYTRHDSHYEFNNSELRCSATTRCLGEIGSQPCLDIKDIVTLNQCACVCEQSPQNEAITVFEQIEFHKSVTIKACKIVDKVGNLTTLRLRDCHFLGGLDLSGVEATAIEIINCQFASDNTQPALRIANSQLVGAIKLDNITIDGECAIRQCEVNDIKASIQFGHLILGPNLTIQEVVDLELAGSSRATFEHIENKGKTKIDTKEQAECNIHHSQLLADADFHLNDGGHSLQIEHSGINGRLRIVGATIAENAVPIPFAITHCRLDNELIANGTIALTVENTQIQGDISVTKALDSLMLQESVINGEIDLRNVRFVNAVTLQGVTINRLVRAERSHFNALTIGATTCVGQFLFSNSHFAGDLVISQPVKSSDITSVIFRDQLDFSKACFQGQVDLSNTALERVLKFQGAEFHQDADFRYLQADGDLIFNGAKFHAQAQFSNMLVKSFVNYQDATFHIPPDFSNSTFERIILLQNVCWPLASKPKTLANFQNSNIGGLLDLSNPIALTTKKSLIGTKTEDLFWLNLRDSNIDNLDLDIKFMDAILKQEERNANMLPKQERLDYYRQLTGVAQLFETSLRKKMRFDEADRFYRKANNYQGGWGSKFMNLIWGHGTLPWLVLFWMVVVSAALGGFSWLVSSHTGQTTSQILRIFAEALAGEVPSSSWDSLPLGFLVVFIVLLCFQIILFNLFFAALARKLLRW